MKNIKKNSVLLSIVSILSLVSACSHDTLPVYEDVDRVYFKWAKPYSLSSDKLARGTEPITVLFGYDNPVKSDSTVGINVCLLGHVSDKDRPVSAELIKNESSAVAGQDIEILPSFIPAGETEGKLIVKLKNSEYLKNNQLHARIHLVPNEYFHVDYTEATGFPYDPKNGTEYNIYFDAKAYMPSLWADLGTGAKLKDFFGAYSNVKLQVICEVCGVTRDFFMHDPATQKAIDVLDSRMPTETVYGMVSRVNRYLKDYKDTHGEPLLDENGVEVKTNIPSIL